MSLDSKLVAN